VRFVSSRELRNNPGSVRDVLDQDDVVLTANGKPFALLVRVEEDDLEDTLQRLRRIRAQQAIARMQRAAHDAGADHLSDEEIDREIRAARVERGEPR
jgi:antitoxin (DNA-binding transcriptional repressor) of toxin-antitoxin stability system